MFHRHFYTTSTEVYRNLRDFYILIVDFQCEAFVGVLVPIVLIVDFHGEAFVCVLVPIDARRVECRDDGKWYGTLVN